MKKEKMNDKGFSLVELIIVIAIMAVLIVVLAPQYLKYVEKSRNSTDLQNATEMVTALQVYASDPDVPTAEAYTAGETFTVTVSSSGTSVSGTAAKAALYEAGLSTGKDKEPATTCVSRTNWKSYKITGKVETNGSITFTYSSSKTGDDGTGDNVTFANAMAGKTTTTPAASPTT